MSETEKHPCPGEWNWWASYDGGEHYNLGPGVSRDDIVQQVIDDQCGEFQLDDGTWKIRAHIAECQVNHIDLAEWFHVDDFLERAGERMEDDNCGSDENGDHHPLADVTDNVQKDLEASIRDAIRGWQKKHELKLRSYWFRHIRNEEDVVLPHPGDDDDKCTFPEEKK